MYMLKGLQQVKGWALRVFLGMFGIAVFFYVGAFYLFWAENRAPRLPLTKDQRTLFDEAQRRICDLDRALCDQVFVTKLENQVVQLPPFFDIGKAMYMTHGGEVSARKEGGYRLEISRHVYESGHAALAVVLYHEMRHIADSDFALYNDDAEEELACLDHNAVKSATVAFAEDYDRHFPSAGQDARFYAGLHGNTLQAC